MSNNISTSKGFFKYYGNRIFHITIPKRNDKVLYLKVKALKINRNPAEGRNAPYRGPNMEDPRDERRRCTPYGA